MHNHDKTNSFKLTNILIYVWFLMTITFAFLNFIVFLSPYWLSTGSLPLNNKIRLFEEENLVYITKHQKQSGFLGLYKYCIRISTVYILFIAFL